MLFRIALGVVRRHLKKDRGLFFSYQSNIAMSFVDNYHRSKNKYKNSRNIKEIANDAAIEFLNRLIG